MPFPIDENYIMVTEEKLGVRFPPSFRNKMMRDNGGEVETPPDAWQLYPFFDSSDQKRIKRTCNDIVRETASAKNWTGFPNNALAIGSNGGGDKLILITSEDGTTLRGEVFWWDHETASVSKVADDFRELKIK